MIVFEIAAATLGIAALVYLLCALIIPERFS